MIPIKNKKKNLEATVEEMRNFSVSYLEKYSPSKQQLKTYLLKKYLKSSNTKNKKQDLIELIDIVLKDLEESKFISDKFYSEMKAKNLIQRGSSINKIRNYLIAKGINNKYIKETINNITDNNEIDVKSKIGGLDKESKDSFVQEVSDNVKSRLSLKKISRRFWYSAGLFIMSTLLVIAAIVIRMNYYHLQIGYLLPVSLGLAGFSLLFSGLLLYFKRKDSQLCLKNFDKINAMVPAEQYATSAEISLSNSAHGEEIQNNHSPESISVRPEVNEEVNRGRYGGDV